MTCRSKRANPSTKSSPFAKSGRNRARHGRNHPAPLRLSETESLKHQIALQFPYKLVIPNRAERPVRARPEPAEGNLLLLGPGTPAARSDVASMTGRSRRVLLPHIKPKLRMIIRPCNMHRHNLS